jgi:hypothetical protein
MNNNLNKDNSEPVSSFDNLIKDIPESEGPIAPVNNQVNAPIQTKDASNIKPANQTPLFNQAINLDNNISKDNLPSTSSQETAPVVNQPSDLGNAPIAPVNPAQASQNSIPSTEMPTLKKEAATIGTVKPDKQKSPFAMLFLFIILILIIMFMPQINTLVDTYIMPYITGVPAKTTTTSQSASTTTDDTTKTTTDTTKFYDLNNQTTVTLDKLTINNISKANTNNLYTITLTIKNTDTNAYTFSKKLYLELYDQDSTFLSRALFDYQSSIASNNEVNVTGYISADTYNKATKFEVVLRTADDYPEVSLAGDNLTCSTTNSNIMYTFKENKLTKITDSYTYVKGTDLTTYNTDLITYKQNISKMDALTGVTGVLTETTNGFITTTIIDYTDAKYSELTTKTNYYDKDTLAKVISFEMASKNYTCK